MPFLGAGANCGVLPLGSQLAQIIAERLLIEAARVGRLRGLTEEIAELDLGPYEELKRLGFQDLARVALRYEAETDTSDLIDVLKNSLPDAVSHPSRLLRTLAGLPFRLVVTTNYDRLMELALELLGAGSIADPAGLSAKLRAGADPLSAYLGARLPAEVRRLLDEYEDPPALLASLRAGGNPLAQFLEKEFSLKLEQLLEDEDGLPRLSELFAAVLAEELDRLLLSDSLYDENEPTRLAHVNLPPEVLGLVGDDLRGVERVRVNRLILEAAYPDVLSPHVRPYRSIVQPIRGFEGLELRRQEEELAGYRDLIVYKFHGSLGEQEFSEASRLVITEEDYIEFLTFVGGQGQGILTGLKERIVDSTLLFLGYGLEDWNFRILFKGLVEKLPPRQQRKSFAIQKNPSEFWVKFWMEKRVLIYNVDLDEFAAELEEKYRDYVNGLPGGGGR